MKTEGLTHFQMEMEYLINTRIHQELSRVYTDITYRWGEYAVCIETKNGYCKGIIINVHPSNYEVYKQERKRGVDRIYHWFNNGIKTVGGEEHCDNKKEFEWLMAEVILPIQLVVDQLEEKNITRVFIDENEVRRVTGSTKKMHKELVHAVKRLHKDLKEITGWDVMLSTTEYYSYTHITYGETARMAVFGDNGGVVYVFRSGTTQVTSWMEDEEGEGYPILDLVVKKVMKTRGFTKYDRGRLMELMGDHETND